MDTVQLPQEILLHIFRFLTPCDIARLRTVSKLFRDLSFDIWLWRSVYANAPIPRPPGPFPWQSCQVLQDILLQSERLARTWTTRPCRFVQSPKPIGDRYMFRRFIQSGRLWWTPIDVGSKTQIVCRDLDDGRSAVEQVVWEWDGPFTFTVCLDASFDGQVVFVYVEDRNNVGDPTWRKVLKCEVKLDGRLLPVSETWDVPLMVQLDGGISCRGSTVHLAAAFPGPLVLDTRSGTFYLAPVFRAQSKMGDFTMLADVTQCQSFLLDETQLLCVSRWCNVVGSMLEGKILFQVFALPETRSIVALADVDSDVSELHLTHESVFPEIRWWDLTLLRYPFYDPASQSTKFKLLRQTEISIRTYYECLTVTLSESSSSPSDTVLPLTFQTQTLFTVDDDNAVSTALDVSEDGHGRGYWTAGVPSSLCLRDIPVQTFSIDASGDVCRAVVGHPSTLYSEEHSDPRTFITSSDCFKGRFWVARGGRGDVVQINAC